MGLLSKHYSTFHTPCTHARSLSTTLRLFFSKCKKLRIQIKSLLLREREGTIHCFIFLHFGSFSILKCRQVYLKKKKNLIYSFCTFNGKECSSAKFTSSETTKLLCDTLLLTLLAKKWA